MSASTGTPAPARVRAVDRRPCRRARTRCSAFAISPSWSSRFAHWLAARGVAPGDRVAIMLEPSLPFYAGAVRRYEARAPSRCRSSRCSGPMACALRVEDCTPRLLVTNAEKAPTSRATSAASTSSSPTTRCWRRLRPSRALRAATRAPTTWRCFQYTSGTTRELPEAVKHTHRAIVDADGRGALRHRHPARRSVLLPVVAGVGPRPLARHAGAAGARRHHRRLCRQVRRRSACCARCRSTGSPTSRPRPPTTA